jgi:hypothetical protein
MQAKYWIFFVIVAVGLALSWGQIGRKAERALTSAPVVFLTTEQPCRPREAPCAALASDRALVLGPVAPGLGIRQTGLAVPAVSRVEAIALSADGSQIDSYLPALGDEVWRLPELPAEVAVLRVRVSADDEVTVADFPL